MKSWIKFICIASFVFLMTACSSMAQTTNAVEPCPNHAKGHTTE
ncbi:hypothetical protein [Bacillus thuringiensis]